MYIEERIYTLQPGKVPAFLKIYEEKGLAPQREILGNLVGYYFTEIGGLNRIVHLWAYQTLDDRDRRRAELVKNAAFQEYLAAVTPLITDMENRIMKPAPFFAAELERMLAASKA